MRTFGAPSGAFGGINGSQSGVDSRMSVLMTPLNGFTVSFASSAFASTSADDQALGAGEHRPGWMKGDTKSPDPHDDPAWRQLEACGNPGGTPEEVNDGACSQLPVSRRAVDDAHLLRLGQLVPAAVPRDRRRVPAARRQRLEQDDLASLCALRPVHRRLQLPDRQWQRNGATQSGGRGSRQGRDGRIRPVGRRRRRGRGDRAGEEPARQRRHQPGGVRRDQGQSPRVGRGEQMTEIGPVDYLIVAFPGNEFRGEIAPALGDLVEAGTIRIIDLAFVGKDAEGNVAAFELTDIDPEVREGFEKAGVEVNGLFNEDDLAAAGEELEPNSSAALLVWENVWARNVAQAMRDAGGDVLDFERIPHEVVQAAREAALANV